MRGSWEPRAGECRRRRIADGAFARGLGEGRVERNTGLGQTKTTRVRWRVAYREFIDKITERLERNDGSVWFGRRTG
jgi:hypothetical protein